MYDRALELVTKAHAGQTDKIGQPYIGHPLAVAERVQSESARVVALLHDVVEDTPLTLSDLTAAGFAPEVVDAVDAMTKREGEQYDAYLARVAACPLAKEVKLADLAHNTDPARLSALDDATRERLKKKYDYAQRVLSGAE